MALLPLLLACAGAPSPAPEPAPVEVAAPSTDDADVAAVDAAPAMPGLVSEAAFKAMHELKADATVTSRAVPVELPGGGTAWLSLPEGATPPLPAVVVIHEWWGLNEHIKLWADRLADDGYAALAVDLYGQPPATTRDEAMAMMKAVDPERATAVLDAAHAFLAADTRVQAKRRASVGWCFGGAWSLRHALHTPDLDAAVVYYGRVVTEPAELAPLNAPLLGVFANQDQGIPPEAVDAFEAAMKEAGKSLTVLRYDADHAFANPSGARYDAAAAEDAWDKVRVFLAEHLKG